MKIKVLTPNKDGLFCFKKEEIEDLLQEAYDEGYQEGLSKNIYCGPYPKITNTGSSGAPVYRDSPNITC